MKHFATFALTALVAVAALGSAQARPGPVLGTYQVGSTTVTASVLATGLHVAVGAAVGPDNFIWMTERNGRVSRVNPATGQPQLLLAVADVTETGESSQPNL